MTLYILDPWSRSLTWRSLTLLTDCASKRGHGVMVWQRAELSMIFFCSTPYIYIYIYKLFLCSRNSSQLYENKYNYIYSFVFVDQLSVIFFRRSYQTNQYTSMILEVVSNQLWLLHGRVWWIICEGRECMKTISATGIVSQAINTLVSSLSHQMSKLV